MNPADDLTCASIPLACRKCRRNVWRIFQGDLIDCEHRYARLHCATAGCDGQKTLRLALDPGESRPL